MRKGFTMVADCYKCSRLIQDVEPLFWICFEAKQVWLAFLPKPEFNKQDAMSFKDWIRYNLKSKFSCGHDMMVVEVAK